MLNITHYQRNANQNHDEVPFHTSQNVCYTKIYIFLFFPILYGKLLSSKIIWLIVDLDELLNVQRVQNASLDLLMSHSCVYVLSHSVVFDSLQPHGLQPPRL